MVPCRIYSKLSMKNRRKWDSHICLFVKYLLTCCLHLWHSNQSITLSHPTGLFFPKHGKIPTTFMRYSHIYTRQKQRSRPPTNQQTPNHSHISSYSAIQSERLLSVCLLLIMCEPNRVIILEECCELIVSTTLMSWSTNFHANTICIYGVYTFMCHGSGTPTQNILIFFFSLVGWRHPSFPGHFIVLIIHYFMVILLSTLGCICVFWMFRIQGFNFGWDNSFNHGGSHPISSTAYAYVVARRKCVKSVVWKTRVELLLLSCVATLLIALNNTQPYISLFDEGMCGACTFAYFRWIEQNECSLEMLWVFIYLHTFRLIYENSTTFCTHKFHRLQKIAFPKYAHISSSLAVIN